jgi:hypothetical protein
VEPEGGDQNEEGVIEEMEIEMDVVLEIGQ